MRTLHAWWAVIGVVLGVAAGGTPSGGGAQRPSSCLTQPPTVQLPPRQQPAPYDRDWPIRNVHVVYGRDDCIENDWYNTGLIDSSFFDGCYDVMSSLQDPGLDVPDGRTNVVTIRNSLLRLQVMDGIYETRPAPPRHEAFWKWSATRGPGLSLHDNVFFSDDSSVSSNHADMYMAPPPGRLIECAGNIMIWEGNGPFPERLPGCFTLVTQPGR